MRKIAAFFFFSAITLMPVSAAALTSEQIGSMSLEEILALPVQDFLMATYSEVTPQEVRANFSIKLRTLGYFMGLPDGADSPEWNRAVREFQTAISKEPTGTLTVSEAAALVTKSKAFSPDSTTVPPRFISVDERGFFIQGTWVGRNESRETIYLNYATVSCFLNGPCREIQMRREPGLYGFTYLWRLFTTDWTIRETTSQRLTATGFKGRCVGATLTIDVAAQTASMNWHGSGDTGCEPLTQNMGDYDLVDGETLSETMRSDAEKARDVSLNPAYRAEIEKLRKGSVFGIIDAFDILFEPPPAAGPPQ